MMAASTVLVLPAVVFLALLIFGNFRYPYHVRDMIGAVVLGALSFASGLFAAGFLWDRVRRRDEGH